MDPEDLEDLDCERADRSGHSFDGYQQNPYYSKITTAIPLGRPIISSISIPSPSKERIETSESHLTSSFYEKPYNRGSGHTTPVAPAAPPRHRAFLASAPAAGAPLDAR